MWCSHLLPTATACSTTSLSRHHKTTMLFLWSHSSCPLILTADSSSTYMPIVTSIGSMVVRTAYYQTCYQSTFLAPSWRAWSWNAGGHLIHYTLPWNKLPVYMWHFLSIGTAVGANFLCHDQHLISRTHLSVTPRAVVLISASRHYSSILGWPIHPSGLAHLLARWSSSRSVAF